MFVKLPLYFCIFFPIFLPVFLLFRESPKRTICIMAIMSNIVSLFIFCVYIYFLYKNSSPAICNFVTFFLDSFQKCGFFTGLVAWIVSILSRYLLFLLLGFLIITTYCKLMPKLYYFFTEWNWNDWIKKKEKEEKKK